MPGMKCGQVAILQIETRASPRVQSGGWRSGHDGSWGALLAMGNLSLLLDPLEPQFVGCPDCYHLPRNFSPLRRVNKALSRTGMSEKNITRVQLCSVHDIHSFITHLVIIGTHLLALNNLALNICCDIYIL